MHVLNDPLGQELLHDNPLARLAYAGQDGYPRVIPIGFYWNGAEIVVCTATTAPKVRALATNPKVALTIDTNTQPPHVLLVRGTAHIEIVNGVPFEYLEASKKGVPKPQWEAFEAQVRAMYPQMARIAITPEWAKLFDFETRLPGFLEELARRKTGASTKNTLFIRATREAIYRAITDPAALEVWFAPGDMTARVHRFDHRVGGGYQMSLYYPASETTSRGKSAEREDRYTARFIELAPPRRIVEAVTFESEDPSYAGEMIMEVTLEPGDGGTTVSIVFKDLPPGIRPEDNEKGTQQTLEKLARFVG